MLKNLKVKVKSASYRAVVIVSFFSIILVTNGVFTPSIAYATDSGEEATDSETPVSTTETASSEVIQESDSEAETQSAVEEEEPIAAAMGMSSLQEPSPSATVNELVTGGGDDSSYQIPIQVPVVFDGVSYSNIYATTNSVITFGNPDGTYWDYPMTPSVSIHSRDWWARPYLSDEWFIIRTSQGGFQVDGSYRPFGTNGGPTTQIVITAQIQTNGTVSYTYSVAGPLYGGERLGARLTNGTVVPLELAGVNEVEEPVILEPEPVEPEPEPEPEPVRYLNSPTNLYATENSDGSVTLTWSAPEESNTAVERYAVSWSNGSAGWGVASTTTNITIPAEVFASTGGLNVTYSFTVRADNDSLSVYSAASSPTSGTPAIGSSEQEQDPSEGEQEEQNPGTIPSPNPPALPTGQLDRALQSQQSQELATTEQPQEQSAQSNPESASQPTPKQLLEEVLNNPDSSKEEKIAAIIASLADGEFVTLEILLKAGLSYADLPPGTPVEVRTDEHGNPVVISAEVAAALSVLETPQQFFEELVKNPIEVLKAITHVGKDMSEKERNKAEEVVVSAVVMSNVAYVASNAAAIGGAITYRRKP